MQQPIGSTIRHLRREQNLTQSELGGTAFSKSYVSAVEKGRLVPSLEALRHFALCLGKSEDYFLRLNEESPQGPPLPVQETASAEWQLDMTTPLALEKGALLDTLIEHVAYQDFPVPESFFPLSAEALAVLSPAGQAHYALLQGRMFQQQADYVAAARSFETALARETHPAHAAIILDELRACYLALDSPQVALHYAGRAHQLLLEEPSFSPTSPFPFRIELHCGEMYLTLGRYQQALEHFEHAHAHLDAQQHMRLVGRLYWGLGYCTYALVYHQTFLGNGAADQIEYQYQRALSYLLQSYTLAQAGGDLPEMRRLRLTLAMTQLDLGTWRRRGLRHEEDQAASQHFSQASLASVLDEVGEHARQVVTSFQRKGHAREGEVLKQREVAFLALAVLIRAAVQRALLAHSSGYESLLQRERSFAASLCQHTVDACQDEALLETLLWNVTRVPESFADAHPSALPRLPESVLPREEEKRRSVLLSQAEVSWAAGEVAEMLGRTASTPDFVSRCYAHADACFGHALGMLSQVRYTDDGGYATRAHQRYLSLLEERAHAVADQAEDAPQLARSLLVLCKRVLEQPLF